MAKQINNQTGNGFGISGFVLGILSVLIGWIVPVIGLVTSILGIVFSVKQNKDSPNGLATAGLITSILGLVLTILFWILYTLAFLSEDSLLSPIFNFIKFSN